MCWWILLCDTICSAWHCLSRHVIGYYVVFLVLLQLRVVHILIHCLFVAKHVSWPIYWYPKQYQLVSQRGNQFNRILWWCEIWSEGWCFDSVLLIDLPYNWCTIAKYDDPSHLSSCFLVSCVIFIHKSVSWHWFPSGIWNIDGYWLLIILVEVLPIEWFESILWYWRLRRIKV